MERPSWKGDEDGPTAILARGPSSSHSTHWGDLSRFLPEIPPQLFLILSNSSVRSSIPPARAYIRDDYDRDHVARPAPGEDPAAYVIVHPRPSVAVSVVDSVHPSFCGMRWLHCPSPGVEISWQEFNHRPRMCGNASTGGGLCHRRAVWLTICAHCLLAEARRVSSGRNAGIAVRAENASSGANSTRRQQLAGYVPSVFVSWCIELDAVPALLDRGRGGSVRGIRALGWPWRGQATRVARAAALTRRCSHSLPTIGWFPV